MERWVGKIALVTGASAGIGEAIVEALVEHGVKVVGVARRVERVQALAEKLKGKKGELHALKCDVAKEEDIVATFKWIDDNLGALHILINNAGLIYETTFQSGEADKWRQMFNVNVIGLSICNREAIRSMVKHKVHDGHFININSIAGHSPPLFVPFTLYFATKHAVTVINEGLRRELKELNQNLRTTSISPGYVDTEILKLGNVNGEMKEETKSWSALTSKDIADGVIYAISAPKHVNVFEVTIKPMDEVY